MKKIAVKLILVLFLFSCQKQEPLKPTNNNSVTILPADYLGINWVLSDARFYTENLDNNEKYVYDAFGSNYQSISTSLFSGTINKIDSLKQNFTSWMFQNNTFTLNGETSYPYKLNNAGISIYGLEDGSARQVEIINVTNDVFVVKFHDGYANYNGFNYGYYSELTFVKSGKTCSNCQLAVEYGWVYGGLWGSKLDTTKTDLVNTKWVVVRYNNGLSGDFYPNDTLSFVNSNQYSINGGSLRTYSLSNVNGNNMNSLNLNSFTTLGGDYSGQVFKTFIEDWVISNATFQDVFNVNNSVTLWMERIQ